MDYLKIKRHILDKKSLLLYGIAIFVSCFISIILGYLIYIYGINFSVGAIILLLAIFYLPILLTQCVFLSFYRCKRFQNIFEGWTIAKRCI